MLAVLVLVGRGQRRADATWTRSPRCVIQRAGGLVVKKACPDSLRIRSGSSDRVDKLPAACGRKQRHQRLQRALSAIVVGSHHDGHCRETSFLQMARHFPHMRAGRHTAGDEGSQGDVRSRAEPEASLGDSQAGLHPGIIAHSAAQRGFHSCPDVSIKSP